MELYSRVVLQQPSKNSEHEKYTILLKLLTLKTLYYVYFIIVAYIQPSGFSFTYEDSSTPVVNSITPRQGTTESVITIEGRVL